MAAIEPEGFSSIVRPHEEHGNALTRALSSSSAFSDRKRQRAYDSSDEDNKKEKSMAADWSLMPELQAMQQQSDKDQAKRRDLGVTWKNLTVKGIGADAAINENVGSQFNIPKLIKEGRTKPPLRTLVDNSHGCVKPGEMLLVLGRPGAGCTTLLKMLANTRGGYAEVTGDVHFGSLNHTEAHQYRGQIVMNTEEELFFPTLTVGQTIDFATRMKVPFHRPSNSGSPEEYQQANRDFLLKSMGISHTHETKVGNEYVRGVSGGERKRVSIIEMLASRGSVMCWDNSTRGLDASSALDYTKAIRAMTDIFGMASIVTLYQAGNGIYNLFDKVLVLDEGKQIYYGPMKQARPFMEELGFICDDSANVADFLTGVTVCSSSHNCSQFTLITSYSRSQLSEKSEMNFKIDSPEPPARSSLHTTDTPSRTKWKKNTITLPPPSLKNEPRISAHLYNTKRILNSARTLHSPQVL